MSRTVKRGFISYVLLSEAYKQKLHEASAKLNHRMNEINGSAAKISEELDGVNQEEDSLEHKFQEGERRLEQRFTEQKSDTDLMTVQTPWEEFVSPKNMIENNSTPSAVPLNPDVQNFTKDE